MLQKICFEDYNFTRFRDLKPRFKGDAIDSFIIKVILVILTGLSKIYFKISWPYRMPKNVVT